MKTDQFDDAFRRKVEELHPPSYPDEVARIAGYVRQNLPLSFWQKFGTGISYSITAVTVTALLSTLFYHNYVNKTLLKQVAFLNQKVEKLATIVAQQPDTVFVVQYKNGINSIENTESQPTADLVETNAAAFTQSTANETSPAQNEPLLSTTANEKTLNQLAEKTTSTQRREGIRTPVAKRFTNKNNVPANAENEAENSEDIAFETTAKAANSELSRSFKGQKNRTLAQKSKKSRATSTENSSDQFNAGPPAQDDAAAPETSQNAMILASALLPKPLRLDSTLRPVAQELPAAAFKGFAVSTEAPQIASRERLKIKWPDVSLKNLRFRVGLGSSIVGNQLGAGLLTEVLVGKKWSVTTGLGTAVLKTQEFDDENQFKQRTKEDFNDRDRDAPNNPPNFRIRDIRAREQLMILPIYANFRLPLKNNFTFLVSAGSDFHLLSTRSTSFRRQEFGPSVPRPNQDGSFVERLPNRFFNNLVLMAGIEKRWGNFSVQLNPTLKFQVQNISYQQQNLAAGFQFRAFYRIGK